MEEYKAKLIDFYQTNRRLPGYKEMLNLFGFKSKNAVYKLINKFIDEGLISKDSDGHLSPLEALSGGLKLLGSVQAGLPATAEEDWLETINLGQYFTASQKGNPRYILTVSGDSMIDASICEGDMVIVEKKETAKIGDIVVACVDSDWTLKYLRQDKKGQKYLEPANDKYQDIYPENSLSIGGVVRGVIRKY